MTDNATVLLWSVSTKIGSSVVMNTSFKMCFHVIYAYLGTLNIRVVTKCERYKQVNKELSIIDLKSYYS